MPHLRYVNAQNGTRVSKWQFKKEREPLADIGNSGKTMSHFHLANSGWEDIPNASQLMCYNEIATKQNWHYMCVDFDLDAMAFTGFRFNNQIFDVSQIAPMVMPAMANLWCMLNMVFFVETDCDKRAFLSVDSVMISGEWD